MPSRASVAVGGLSAGAWIYDTEGRKRSRERRCWDSLISFGEIPLMIFNEFRARGLFLELNFHNGGAADRQVQQSSHQRRIREWLHV